MTTLQKTRTKVLPSATVGEYSFSRNRLFETLLLILLANRQSKDCEINLLKSRLEILQGRLVDEKETRKVIQERDQVCTVILEPE